MIERLVITSETDEITTYDLPIQSSLINSKKTLKEILEEFEKKIIIETYNKYQSTYKVADELGISQSTATRKVKKYMLIEK